MGWMMPPRNCDSGLQSRREHRQSCRRNAHFCSRTANKWWAVGLTAATLAAAVILTFLRLVFVLLELVVWATHLLLWLMAVGE